MTDLSPNSQLSDGDYPRPPDQELEAELRSEDGNFNERNVSSRNCGTEVETEATAETEVETEATAEAEVEESADAEMTPVEESDGGEENVKLEQRGTEGAVFGFLA